MAPDDAYRAFQNLEDSVRKKRVPFQITFKQWCDLWEPHIHQRGRLQLQRKEKADGYVEGNLRIAEKPRKK